MNCIECNCSINELSCIRKPINCAKDGCDNLMCYKCAGNCPLIVKDGSGFYSSTIQCFCSPCFRELSVLDYTKTYDLLQPTEGVQVGGCVFVFVHGGGGCRKMFSKHAEILMKKYNHTCILLDLPGHGTLVDTPLTPDSAAETIQNVMETSKDTIQGKSIIYVGGSLGAYIGFYILQKLSSLQLFDGAILLDCGQNVGPHASLKAKLGLSMMRFVGSNFSNATMMSMMQNVVSKSTADFYLNETSLAAGMFFQQSNKQVECLKLVEPEFLIPLITVPILYMNGSKDYRDSEQKWLSLCARQDLSSLKVYDDGDHFFTHDTRFVDDMIERWHNFAIRIEQTSQKGKHV
jgi:pimeloyl-ACP methyl ester carboxylesterase